jgi:hypothetical protein
VGDASETVFVDLGPPGDPAMFDANVSGPSRVSFTLTWKAPADSDGQAVTKYEIRWSKSSTGLDGTAFDSATDISYGAPAQPGGDESVIVSGFDLNTNYYFAIRAVDSVGNKSNIVKVGPKVGTFTPILIPAPAAGLQFGHSVSGDGDLDGDKISDVVVGTLNAGRAYLYLGKSGFNPGMTPTTTFKGTQLGFGYTVAQIGDIDHDGLEDLAIADPLNDQKVFIFKGRPTADWPMTLNDTDADYTITGYAGSLFGASISRLGDFTNDAPDHIDDFAISARSYNSSFGRVVIMRGQAGGYGKTPITPDTTNAITIDADPAIGKSLFGYRVLGIGHYFRPVAPATTVGTTLIVSAIGSTAVTTANMGHVYAFHGQEALGGSIALPADQTIAGPASGARIGVVLSHLGTMLNGFAGVGVGNPLDTIDIPGGHGGSYLMSGDPTAMPPTGPMTTKQITYISGGQSLSGGVQIGGGIPGRDISLSLIGDSTPDLVYAGELGSIITISDGAKIGAKGSPLELGTAAEYTITLPGGWQSGEGTTSIIPDINGDKIPDFCIGSQLQPGGVLVYY